MIHQPSVPSAAETASQAAPSQPKTPIAPARPMPIVRDGELQFEGGRLAAITRGERVPAEYHGEVLDGPAVLEVQDFNLWYGSKQALHYAGRPRSPAPACGHLSTHVAEQAALTEQALVARLNGEHVHE